jgi:hypothetical protein
VLLALVWAMLLWVPAGLFAQTPAGTHRTPATVVAGCGFTGSVRWTNIIARQPHAAYTAAVIRILRVHGLNNTNLSVWRAKLSPDMPGLADFYTATRERRVFYNEASKDLISDSTSITSVGVLAHEVGHQLLGHTLRYARGEKEEAEADYFAGYTLRILNYRNERVKSFMLEVAAGEPSKTHPPAEARAKVALQGWEAADEVLGRELPAASTKKARK